MNNRNWISKSPNFFKNLDTQNFYLIEFVKPNDWFIYRKVNIDECIRINESNKALYEFEYFLRKIEEIKLNLDEFNKVYHKYKNVISKTTNPEQIKHQFTREIFIDINRAFTNYINSCRMFIDHMDARIKHKYGETSAKYKIFKTTKGYCYDTYFSYKLFYHLRNFVAHDDFPIYDIRFNSDWETINRMPGYISDMEIYFNKQRLLQSETVGSKLKKEFKLRNDLFPVIPLVIEYESSLKQIFDSLIKVEIEYYTSHANAIMRFNNMNKYGGVVSIGKFSYDKDGSIIYTITRLYTDVVEELRNAISRL